MKRYILLVLCAITLPAFAVPQQTITRINSLGNVQLDIRPATGAGDRFQILSPAGKRSIRATVRNHTLYIRNQTPGVDSARPVKILVRLHQLNELDASDATSVTTRNLKTDQLIIKADNRGTIRLNGQINLKRIQAKGPGLIAVKWVSGPDINITTQNRARLKLAGVAKQIHIRASGKSRVDAQYLRAQSAVVRTRNQASVKVLAKDALHAFAFGRSNIYYYKNPKRINRYTQDSGNVLQLDWRK